MNGLEERVARIEGIVSQMNERLNHFSDELRSLRSWTLGILIPMWVSIVLTILIKV